MIKKKNVSQSQIFLFWNSEKVLEPVGPRGPSYSLDAWSGSRPIEDEKYIWLYFHEILDINTPKSILYYEGANIS